MDKKFLEEKIDITKVQIEAYEQAAIALVNHGMQSYTLDTGQSRQMVTRLDLHWINKEIDALYSRYATLNSRLNGLGVVPVIPGW